MDARPIDITDILMLGGMYVLGVASTLYAVLAWVHRVRAAERAASWNISDGEILSADVIHEPSSDGPDDYVAQVRYAYRVAGRRLQGDRLRVGGKTIFQDRSLAWAAIARYRAGGRAKVHYDPHKPERSVLETVPTGAGLKQWLIVGIFLLGSAGYINLTLTWQ